MTLAGGVENAVREAPHERALRGAPLALADRVQQRRYLRCDAGAARPRPLHELAHARLAHAHGSRRLRAREPLQVAEGRGLLLANAELQAQCLELLAQQTLSAVASQAGRAHRRAGLWIPVGTCQASACANCGLSARPGARASLVATPGGGYLHADRRAATTAASSRPADRRGARNT